MLPGLCFRIQSPGQIDRAEQRLDADKADRRVRVEQKRNAFVRLFLTLHRDSEPDVRKVSAAILQRVPGTGRLRVIPLHRERDGIDRMMAPELRAIGQHPRWSLRQHLECMLRAERHDGEHAIDVFIAQGFVEQVRHRVDEDPPPALPLERLEQRGFVQADLSGPTRDGRSRPW
jgi:hypothetical protein